MPLSGSYMPSRRPSRPEADSQPLGLNHQVAQDSDGDSKQRQGNRPANSGERAVMVDVRHNFKRAHASHHDADKEHAHAARDNPTALAAT